MARCQALIEAETELYDLNGEYDDLEHNFDVVRGLRGLIMTYHAESSVTCSKRLTVTFRRC